MYGVCMSVCIECVHVYVGCMCRVYICRVCACVCRVYVCVECVHVYVGCMSVSRVCMCM